MRFSPSTLGWYPVEVHYPALPGDLVDVPDSLWRSLAGKPLKVVDGMPADATIEAPSGAVVPASVTMRQARLALLQAEKLGMVDVVISGLPSPQKEAALIDWEFAATVDRGSPTVALLAQALGMNDDELDQLFMLAATF